MSAKWTADLVAGPDGTGGSFALFVVEVRRPLELPAHVNRREDLLVHVLDGELELVLDGDPVVLRAGERRLVRREVPRRASIAAGSRFLLLATPGGLERVAEVAKRPEDHPDDRAALLAAAGISRVPARW